MGTEFGVYFSIDGGGQWTALKSGLPTISVRDMVIQKRENDLVLATFDGDFTSWKITPRCRTVNKAIMESPAHLFGIKNALMFVETGGNTDRDRLILQQKILTSVPPSHGG
ncbi:MAG: hypothetical protein IPN08_09970 [Bacteroidales bacterium]|nr:hypothetical protein [Bacteroidales bacterium]